MQACSILRDKVAEQAALIEKCEKALEYFSAVSDRLNFNSDIGDEALYAIATHKK